MNTGFEIIPNVFGDSELDHISQVLNAAQAKRSRAGIRHLLNIPEILELAQDPRLIDLVTKILGCKPIPFGATLFDKSSETNWLVTWHQDKALPITKAIEAPGWGPWSQKDGVTYAIAPASALEQVVAVRIHLDDSTNDNGSLRVLPDTHRLGVLNDAEIHELSQRIEPVVCTVPRGGLLVMRPLIVHASSKVVSDKPRRVLHLEYAASRTFDNGMTLRAA